MAHPAAVKDSDVFDLLDRLEAARETVTPNRVRTELGGGNPNRYRILIDRWKVARSLEEKPAGDAGEEEPTALLDELVKTIRVGLYMKAPFLDKAFRDGLARELAGRVGGSLIRHGHVTEEALAVAQPDPFDVIVSATTRRAAESAS
jgi:hypothetical protein